MYKVTIYHKMKGYIIATYERNNNGEWYRYSNDIIIEKIEETDLYNIVFGGSSKKIKYFYIIDMIS